MSNDDKGCLLLHHQPSHSVCALFDLVRLLGGRVFLLGNLLLSTGLQPLLLGLPGLGPVLLEEFEQLGC
jgi:hypothetical protein